MASREPLAVVMPVSDWVAIYRLIERATEPVPMVIRLKIAIDIALEASGLAPLAPKRVSA